MTAWPEGESGVVRLPSGGRVRGRPIGRKADEADFRLVLSRHRPAQQDAASRWVRWPDFLPPADGDDALDALHEVRARSARERVEITCRGGRGRTGTALAALLVLEGVPTAEAIRVVRRVLHPRAVETPWQRAWVRGLAVG